MSYSVDGRHYVAIPAGGITQGSQLLPDHAGADHLGPLHHARCPRDEILWEATIEDPDVYDRPWTVSMPLTRAPGYEMYEYACHEVAI